MLCGSEYSGAWTCTRNLRISIALKDFNECSTKITRHRKILEQMKGCLFIATKNTVMWKRKVTCLKFKINFIPLA